MRDVWSDSGESPGSAPPPGANAPSYVAKFREALRRARPYLVTAAALILLSLLFWKPILSRIQIRDGQEALAAENYAEAARYFAAAVELEPDSADARLQLARALSGQYVAGGDSPENLQIARSAHDELARVLQRNPGSGEAAESIASLYYKEGKFDDARQWYTTLIAGGSDHREAFCRLGLMVRSEFFPVRMSARAALGMAPEDSGPIRSAAVRQELRANWLAAINQAIEHLQHAVRIDSNYEEAMAGLNLLFRDRADLAEDSAQYERDLEAAAQWAARASEARRAAAESNRSK